MGDADERAQGYDVKSRVVLTTDSDEGVWRGRYDGQRRQEKVVTSRPNEIKKVVLEEYLEPALSQKGFSRLGSSFEREVGTAIQQILVWFKISDYRSWCCYFANIEFPEVGRLLKLAVAEDAERRNTIGKQMGYLSKVNEFEEWGIGRFTRPKALARRFLTHIDRYAMPFLDRFSSMANVLEALEGGDYFNLDEQRFIMKDAVINFLLGHKRKALELLEKGILENESKHEKKRFMKLKSYLEKLDSTDHQ